LNNDVKLYFPFNLSQQILDNGDSKLEFAFNAAVYSKAQIPALSNIANNGTTSTLSTVKANTNFNPDDDTCLNKEAITMPGSVNTSVYYYQIPNDLVTKKSTEDFYQGTAQLKNSINGVAAKDNNGNPIISASDAIKAVFPNGLSDHPTEQEIFYLFKNIFSTYFDYRNLFGLVNPDDPVSGYN
jgi:hypothetical protein